MDSPIAPSGTPAQSNAERVAQAQINWAEIVSTDPQRAVGVFDAHQSDHNAWGDTAAVYPFCSPFKFSIITYLLQDIKLAFPAMMNATCSGGLELQCLIKAGMVKKFCECLVGTCGALDLVRSRILGDFRTVSLSCYFVLILTLKCGRTVTRAISSRFQPFCLLPGPGRTQLKKALLNMLPSPL